MNKKSEEKLWSINFSKLSNDMLLELWFRQPPELPPEDYQKVVKILKEREVICERI